VIHPLAEIVDFDPNWGEVHDLVRRARLEKRTVYILQRGGKIQRVLGDANGAAVTGAPVKDAAALAREVRAASGADRVVVIDANGLAGLVRSAVAVVNPSWTRPGFRTEVARQYWGSEAVSTDPPPPVAVWGPLEVSLREEFPPLVVVRITLRSSGETDDWLDTKPVLITEIVLADGVATRISSLDSESPVAPHADAELVEIEISWQAAYDLIVEDDPVSLVDELIASGAVTAGAELVRRVLAPLERRPSARRGASRRGAVSELTNKRAGVL